MSFILSLFFLYNSPSFFTFSSFCYHLILFYFILSYFHISFLLFYFSLYSLSLLRLILFRSPLIYLNSQIDQSIAAATSLHHKYWKHYFLYCSARTNYSLGNFEEASVLCEELFSASVQAGTEDLTYAKGTYVCMYLFVY